MDNIEESVILTYEEIEEKFRNDKELDERFKSLILSRLNATYQAMYNCTLHRQNFHVEDPYGDTWVEEHNRVMTEYQRYHN